MASFEASTPMVNEQGGLGDRSVCHRTRGAGPRPGPRRRSNGRYCGGEGTTIGPNLSQ